MRKLFFFFHIPQYLRHLHFSCYALFQNVLHCLKQMLSPFDLILSLAVPLSQVYIPCRTAIVLVNEEIDYCYWNTISDSPRDGNPAHLWLNIPPFTACLPSSFRKHTFSREPPPKWIEYKMLWIPSTPFLYKSLFTHYWISRISFPISHCPTCLKWLDHCQILFCLMKNTS